MLVTSIGTGDSKDAPPSQVYDVLKPVLLEKEKAEARLKVWPFPSYHPFQTSQDLYSAATAGLACKGASRASDGQSIPAPLSRDP